MDRLVEDEALPGRADVHQALEAREARFLGLRLHPKSLPELNDLVESGIREQRKCIIANHNLHSLYLLHKHASFREFYDGADWTYIDGMSLVALGRFYGYPIKRQHRVTYADWMPRLIALAADRGWRVFYVGSRKGVAEKGAAALRDLFPTLQMQVCDGYFDAGSGSAENEAILQQVNRYKPDLLMVGMGMPRQELWIQANFHRLEAHVIMPSGAAIDYTAGAVPTPPRWAGDMGIEWLFRLLSEPRRLFSRYLIEPWYILGLMIMDCLRRASGSKVRD